VEEIKRAVRQAAGLTQQLLAFSRKQVIERHDTGLNTVIRNMENLLRRVIGEDIDFELELGEGLGTVSLDERQFEQVLMNLAVNARDAMPHGGKITVRTLRRTVASAEAAERGFAPGTYCVLTFTDTGIGMDSETRKRVFEPFFTTKEFGKGTGLGMSTVYGVVRQCDGYIVVESEPERGTTCIVYLPETDVKPVEAEQVDQQEESILTGGETVLIVEDDETVRGITKRTLEKYGYVVFTAKDAAEAVEICRNKKQVIDVTLTDVVMPGEKNGFELADWISENHPDIEVIYMSGYADEARAAQEAVRQNSAFLRKPFSTKALLETLREICSAKDRRE
jgi:CheY-like chemotaxis protein